MPSAPSDRAAWLAGVEPARRDEAEALLVLSGQVNGVDPGLLAGLIRAGVEDLGRRWPVYPVQAPALPP